MVQAAMGHLDEKSAAAYFHPDEEMAAEGCQKIVTVLSQKSSKTLPSVPNQSSIVFVKDGECSCPCCSAKLMIVKEKGRNR